MVRWWLSLPVVAGLTLAQQEPLSTLRVTRGENVILVNQYAPRADGGEFILNNPGCEEDVRLSTIYAPEPYLVETLVNNVRMTSRAVFERRPPQGQEQATLELIDAAVEVDRDTLCPQNVERGEEPNVTIYEGRTTIKGLAFNYDNATGIGIMEGPVALERPPEGEGETVTANSETLEFNVDEDKTVLRGGVRVTSGERVSEADALEYDDAAGMAILTGNPARSREGADQVEGRVIEYNLNTNDVVVIGDARAVFEIER